MGIAPLVDTVGFGFGRPETGWAEADGPGYPATGPIEMKPGNSAGVKPRPSPKAVQPRLSQARGQAARVNPTLSEKF